MQSSLTEKNATFWNELCGTEFARSAGLTDDSVESLKRYDDAYLRFYPYLAPYVTGEPLKGKRVLEIGLGYGTLGQLIAQQGSVYTGLDVARGPVDMMALRLERVLPAGGWSVQQGSVLSLPFPDASFDYLYSIGCLHHTGDLPRAVEELRRVLVPGGKAVVMLYNRWSFARLFWAIRYLFKGSPVGARARVEEGIRYHYDHDTSGTPAPHTDFSSRSQVRRLFGGFSKVRIDCQNFEDYSVRRLKWLRIRRERVLRNLARVVGSDLYIVAVR